MTNITIDTARIVDWKTFHDVFASAFGFPSGYGRNMNAWVDCMTSLDNPAGGMSKVHAPKGGSIGLILKGIAEFEKRCPDLWNALLEGIAFVNWRRIEAGQSPVLAPAYFRGA